MRGGPRHALQRYTTDPGPDCGCGGMVRHERAPEGSVGTIQHREGVETALRVEVGATEDPPALKPVPNNRAANGKLASGP